MNIIKSKIFRLLILFYLIGIVFGIVSVFIGDVDVLDKSVINYFDLFKGDFNYIDGLINSFCFSLKNSFFIFICGLFIIGIVIIPLFIIFKGISNSLVIISIIKCFHMKGLVLGFILMLFSILIKDFIYLILSYYGFNISVKEIKVLKNNKLINFKEFYKNYFLRYVILLIFLIFINIFEVYVLSNIIKYIII